MIKIRAFRPLGESDLCLEYIDGHRRVLEDYGIINITSYNKDWITNPFVFGVYAEQNGVMVGAIRIQIADGIHPLPVELAVGKMDSMVYELVTKYWRALRFVECEKRRRARNQHLACARRYLDNQSTSISHSFGYLRPLFAGYVYPCWLCH
jgi:hypothetical protein